MEEQFVKEIEEFGKHMADTFISKDGNLTNEERYSVLKLAEFCINISKKCGEINKKQEVKIQETES